jgi:hypothetical protein
VTGSHNAALDLKRIEAGLRKTTETLAQELARPGAYAPDWSPSEWRIARAVAVLHGVSPLLSRRLRWSGPAGWESFLAEQERHTRARYLRIRELLRLIDEEARTDGVAFLALKGSALHEIGLYAAGERPMADVDLFTDADDAERMAAILVRVRYRATEVSWKHRVFEPAQAGPAAIFGEHCDNAIKIDLHVRIREVLPLCPVDASRLITPPKPCPGLNPYRSQAALLIHLLLHAAGGMPSRSLRLVQLHDLALLSARMSGADWDEVLGLSGSVGGFWWAFPPLSLVARYYDVIPRRILTAAELECRWPLKRSCRQQMLWEVSYSNLQRSVLPGIPWARSVREALGYVAERTALSARMLSMAAVPDRSPAPETGALCSDPESRALRWVSFLPARPATLNAVRRALAQPQ